jgi:hypothetical protein
MTDAPVPIDKQLTPRAARKSRTPESEAPPTQPMVEEFRVVDPFEGKTTKVEGVVGLYHVAQVRDEIAAAAGLEPDGVQIALILRDPYSEASEDNPGVVYVSPAVDVKLVKKALADHEADPQYGVTEEHAEWLKLKERLQGDEDMSTAELRDALRAVANRM